MVVYLDLVFLLNVLADGLALYITARVAGLSIHMKRLIPAALLGGLYAVVCLLPGLAAVGGFFPQMAAAAGLVGFSFGRGRDFLRRFLLFFIISCTMSGALMAVPRFLRSSSGLEILRSLNWKVFFLVGILCYVLLSVIFRGGAKHAVAGELRRGRIERRGRVIEFTALLDTGHTLTDGAGGRPVLILELSALRELWTDAEWAVLSRLPLLGPSECLMRLAAMDPGAFRLLPYRAVGVSAGMLLCFRAERMVLDGRDYGAVTVAVSPTAVSDGGGYTALWGGEMKKGEEHHAA